MFATTGPYATQQQNALSLGAYASQQLESSHCEASFSKHSSRVASRPFDSPHPSRVERSVTARRSMPKLNGPIVTLNLHYGHDECKTVFVHKNYLCRFSKYFRAALNNPAFAEAESQEVDLEETGTEAFDNYLHWVYHGSIPPFEPINLHQLQDFLRLWIFADKYIVPNLQNNVMSHMIKLLNYIVMGGDRSLNFGAAASQQPISSWFEYAYKNTTEGSRLRRALADSLAVRFRGVVAHKLPLELVRDIFESVQQLPDDGGPIHRDPLYYYVNEDID